MRRPFPGNTEVRYAALWSLQCIRDGEATFDLALKSHARWQAAAPDSEFERWRTWWRAHREDPKYRLDPR